jgi:hypothetical protein
MSLNYLTGELSGGERTRELNIFTRDRKELQREIRGLQEMLATLYVSSDLHEEGSFSGTDDLGTKHLDRRTAARLSFFTESRNEFYTN